MVKRCPFPRRQWLRCSHSWHFDFFKGRKFRFRLDKIASARSEPLPRSKGDGEALADRGRSEIRLGTFRDPNHAPDPAAAPDGRLTLNDVLDRYCRLGELLALRWRDVKVQPAPKGRRAAP